MRPTKTQIIIAGIVLILVVLGFLIFTGVLPGLRSNNTSTLSGSLTVWGVFDSERAMSDSLIKDFQTKNPAVTVRYRRFDVQTYEQELINALAAGTGPDVFMIHNSWLPKHADKITPFAANTFTPAQLAELFPSVVSSDFVANNSVYALPLYLDSLALLYNKQMFDEAGIAEPPKTWVEFENIIPSLSNFDASGRITQAAAAIGGSERNINEASDLFTLMMMQDRIEIISKDRTLATFSPDGVPVLTYYTSFVDAGSDTYTWDPTLHYSIDAFSEESVAMIFNYAHQLPLLRAKNPFLDIGIAPMLQLGTGGEVNYANYWGLAVSNKSLNKTLAYPFILNSTTDPQASVTYLNATSRPPALRSLITLNSKNPGLGIFARQALTARSWYKIDDTSIDSIFSRMIDSVITGQLSATDALNQAEEKITQLMRR